VLQSYLDDDVEPDFAARIAEHLEACKDCGLEAETYAQIKNSLADRRPEVGSDVVTRLRDFGESLTGD
jgi:anti-sigma factor RsiW